MKNELFPWGLSMERHIPVFWNLMGAFAKLYEIFPTIETARVIKVYDDLDHFKMPIPETIRAPFSEEPPLASGTVPQFQMERIEFEAVAFEWWDDYGPVRLFVMDAGYGPKTNVIVHKTVSIYHRSYGAHWRRLGHNEYVP